MTEARDEDAPLTLVVRKLVRAPAAKVFAAWTEPAQLRQWFGPRDVTCTAAEVDLRAGGRYRLGNRFPDGTMVWIAGEFEQVAPPHLLVYSWHLETDAGAPERVTVRFEPRDGATEVTVTHERIASAALRDGHEAGWLGCVDKLAAFLG